MEWRHYITEYISIFVLLCTGFFFCSHTLPMQSSGGICPKLQSEPDHRICFLMSSDTHRMPIQDDLFLV